MQQTSCFICSINHNCQCLFPLLLYNHESIIRISDDCDPNLSSKFKSGYLINNHKNNLAKGSSYLHSIRGNTSAIATQKREIKNIKINVIPFDINFDESAQFEMDIFKSKSKEKCFGRGKFSFIYLMTLGTDLNKQFDNLILLD